MSAVFLSNIPVNMMIRGGKYHYRRRVPVALVDLFGRKEVTKSLNTTDPRQASRLRSQLDGQIESLFQACRFSSILPDVARAQLKAILEGKQLQTTTKETQPNTIVIAAPSKRRGKRLADAIEALSKEKEHSWSLKTQKEYTGIFKKLLSSLNDPWLQDLDRPILVAFRDALSKEGKSLKTVNKYLGTLSTVLRHANRLKWIQGNPAEGLGLQDNRRPDEIRRAFTKNEIETIFEALQRDKQGFYDKKKHERYWLPILGLYTGARVNELAQLELVDIIEEGIPAIVITSSGGEGKRVKRASSRRTVPLHKDLLTLGFLVYVRNISQQGHTRLFPTLKLGPNGYQHYFNSHHFSGSKGWLKKLLPNLAKGESFHLFRHSFTDMLKNADVEESLAKEITGHSNDSITYNRYGKPYRPEKLLPAINKVDYGLLPEVKTVVKHIDDERTNSIQEHDYLVCGKTEIRIFLEDKEQPIELEQYKRPDLHGYSPFHDEIEGFMRDEVVDEQ